VHSYQGRRFSLPSTSIEGGIHWNPVKHHHIRCPYEWLYSSFHRYVQLGVYDRKWGYFTGKPIDFSEIEDTVGE